MLKKAMIFVCAMVLIFLAIQPVAAMQNQATITVPTPRQPSGIIRDTTPTYEWNDLAGASAYQVQLVKKNSTVYTFTVIKSDVCSEYKCSFTPGGVNFQGANPSFNYILGPGGYTWRIQAKFGTVWKAYSLARAFSYATVPDTRNPSGTISMDTPQFSFDSIVGATQYQIELKKNHKAFYVQTFSDAQCDEFGYCQKTPSIVLGNGTYAWRVRSYVEGVWKGFSTWHEFKLVDHVTVFVPQDFFQMGCDPTHNMGFSCGSDEYMHSVLLTGFYIDKYEVTNKQYSECVLDSNCSAPVNWSSNSHGSYYANPAYANYPVIYVNWDQANIYCQATGGWLPTEAQWEKAARGTSPRAFPWGDSPADCSKANIQCNNDTTQVGNYPLGASKYGAMDMTGNVWEWTSDWYSAYYYNLPWPWINPTGPSWELGMSKSMRGGAYNATSDYGITHNRYYSSSESQTANVGFRCAYSDQ